MFLLNCGKIVDCNLFKSARPLRFESRVQKALDEMSSPNLERKNIRLFRWCSSNLKTYRLSKELIWRFNITHTLKYRSVLVMLIHSISCSLKVREVNHIKNILLEINWKYKTSVEHILFACWKFASIEHLHDN